MLEKNFTGSSKKNLSTKLISTKKEVERKNPNYSCRIIVISIEGPECVDHEPVFQSIQFVWLDTMLTVIITLTSEVGCWIVDSPLQLCFSRD